MPPRRAGCMESPSRLTETSRVDHPDPASQTPTVAFVAPTTRRRPGALSNFARWRLEPPARPPGERAMHRRINSGSCWAARSSLEAHRRAASHRHRHCLAPALMPFRPMSVCRLLTMPPRRAKAATAKPPAQASQGMQQACTMAPWHPSPLHRTFHVALPPCRHHRLLPPRPTPRCSRSRWMPSSRWRATGGCRQVLPSWACRRFGRSLPHVAARQRAASCHTHHQGRMSQAGPVSRTLAGPGWPAAAARCAAAPYRAAACGATCGPA